MRNCFLLLVVFGLPLPILGQDDNDPARLISRLGSRRFQEREAAMTALARLRTPASVEALRQAAHHPDIEIRKRVQDLLAVIERSLESEQMLMPQTIRLEFKDAPVTDAVADFARRTGFRIVLADADKAKLAGRKLTLDTGKEVSYWEALRQLCAQAGLHEKPPAPNARRAVEPYENLGRRRRIIWMSQDRYEPPPVDQIVLADGKLPLRPAYQAGAFRLEVLSRPGGPQAGPPKREVELTLAADIEPRFNWSRLVCIRVEQALDDQGQQLSQPRLFIGDQPNMPMNMEEILIVWDGTMEMPRVPARVGSIRLRLGEKPARMLKELRGKLSAEVKGPAGALVTVPDILKASGKTFKGPDRSAVRVMEAKRENSGQYKLQVEVTLPPAPNPFPDFGGNVVWLNRGGGQANMTVSLSAAEVQQKGLALLDAEGQPLLLASGHYVRPTQPIAPLVYTLYFQPRKDQGDASKFVLTGRRHVLIDVPFILRDVPLP